MKLIALLSLFTLSLSVGAAPFVINGIEISKSTYPDIIQYEIFDKANVMTYCTGTYLSPNTILTAAHCVYKPDIELSLDQNLEVKAIIIPEVWRSLKVDTRQDSDLLRISFDLAIIVLQENAKNHKGMSYSHGAMVGPAKMVGFGGANVRTVHENKLSNDPTFGIKRVGAIYLEKIMDQGRINSQKTYYNPRNLFDYEYYTREDNSYAQSSGGDSGGPIFQNGKIVAVISSADIINQTNTKVYSLKSFFAGLHSDVFKELIRKARKSGSSL